MWAFSPTSKVTHFSFHKTAEEAAPLPPWAVSQEREIL